MGEKSYRDIQHHNYCLILLLFSMVYIFCTTKCEIIPPVKVSSQVVGNPGEHPHLIYSYWRSIKEYIWRQRTEVQSCNSSSNLEQPKHCFVKCFKLYIATIACVKKTTLRTLYTCSHYHNQELIANTQPYGHNHLAGTVVCICRNITIISGYETNPFS